MVDALCSGRSVGNHVLVRIQSWAQCPFSKAERAFLFVSVASLLQGADVQKATRLAKQGRTFLLEAPLQDIWITEGNPVMCTNKF